MTVKNCKTCAHRVGSRMEFAKCNKVGWYCSTARKFPLPSCNENFSGWEPRPGVFERLVIWLKGAK